ncbi:hypothetical protein MLD38_022184 [Melastoma candidum]|uniref:Uncharacterized protein n=1 Tax=Melastoma candidum TaxID=119954 RepID=A0ACB9QIY5_9MYRT|nr:hypothetical protein MLD38_022184 [Melastoma candidum]
MPTSPADSSPSSPVKATLPSPWAAVVRGDDDKEPTPPPPASSPSLAAPELLPWEDHRDAASDGNAGPGKAGRPAWKALPNGAIEVSAGKDVDGGIGGGSSGVMGDDVAWPALSESTRASSKSSSSESLASANLSKAPAEGSSSGSQVFPALFALSEGPRATGIGDFPAFLQSYLASVIHHEPKLIQ